MNFPSNPGGEGQGDEVEIGPNDTVINYTGAWDSVSRIIVKDSDHIVNIRSVDQYESNLPYGCGIKFNYVGDDLEESIEHKYYAVDFNYYQDAEPNKESISSQLARYDLVYTTADGINIYDIRNYSAYAWIQDDFVCYLIKSESHTYTQTEIEYIINSIKPANTQHTDFTFDAEDSSVTKISIYNNLKASNVEKINNSSLEADGLKFNYNNKEIKYYAKYSEESKDALEREIAHNLIWTNRCGSNIYYDEELSMYAWVQNIYEAGHPYSYVCYLEKNNEYTDDELDFISINTVPIYQII